MSKGFNGGTVVALTVVALLSGTAAGYYIPGGSGPDTSKDGRIDYACAIAHDLSDADLSEPYLGYDWRKISKIRSISALLSNGQITPADDAAEEEVLSYELFSAIESIEPDALSHAVRVAVEYCDAQWLRGSQPPPPRT
ncbi:hypothetical protein [Flaviflexus sp.]|uniref:hypothetical protein n=1 Tax=Flaviflexus sp. TaxID=1969482 RepID=UPI003F8FA743